MSLKDKLQGISDKEKQTNLYVHLQNVLTKILLDHPKNAYELFEDFSVQVKQSGYDFSKHQAFDNPSRISVDYEAIRETSEKTSKAIGKINLGTVDDPQEPGPCGYVPNMMEEAKWFEWAGMGFGQDETYKIFKSLTLLSITKQVKQVRLWGKIFGTQRDYYVAEGQAESAADDGELPFNVETRGTGINKLNYWVTNDILSGDWIELPLLWPHHIEVSRKVRYIFTGNLDAPVITNPFFFGKEKHLLKAQIIRIAHSTAIVPKGQFNIPEGEEREIAPTDEFKQPPFETQRVLENWVHFNPAIQKNGRLTHIVSPDLDPEKDPQKELELLVAADPYEPRLKPISQDTNLGAKAWKLRTLGDQSDYNPLAKNQNDKVNYGVIVIKSLVWPGLVNVAHNKQYQQLYVGYGFKQSDKQFYPKEPQQVQVEAVDREEQPEPNFPPDAPADPQQ